MALQRRQARVIPGFGLSLGYTMLYLSLLVLIPLSAVFVKSATLTWAKFYETVTRDEVMSAYLLSIGASLVAAVFNVFIGLLTAWVLVRYSFPGRRLLDAMIDLPFALPTAVAGIALVTLYADTGWIGKPLAELGFSFPWLKWAGWNAGFPITIHWFNGVAYTPLGVTLALVFIGLPFVVRTIQPVLQDLGKDVEEAAQSLGATRWQTFRRVILPELMPAIITGFALALARGLGEYGSIVFISGNRAMETEIVPHQIAYELEKNNYAEATSIAVVMLIASFLILLLLNIVQRWYARRWQA
jgi:sulfate transport system permease protein